MYYRQAAKTFPHTLINSHPSLLTLSSLQPCNSFHQAEMKHSLTPSSLTFTPHTHTLHTHPHTHTLHTHPHTLTLILTLTLFTLILTLIPHIYSSHSSSQSHTLTPHSLIPHSSSHSSSHSHSSHSHSSHSLLTLIFTSHSLLTLLTHSHVGVLCGECREFYGVGMLTMECRKFTASFNMYYWLLPLLGMYDVYICG